MTIENKTSFSRIKINKVKTSGQLVRSGMDDDHVIELASSISSLGLLQPIVVEEIEDGQYQLIAGAHRLAACTRLNWTHIPAMLREKNKNIPIRAAALVENIVRKTMSLSEEVAAVAILYGDEKKSPSQICQLVGKSRAWVDRRLAIPSLHPRIIEELMEGRIKLNVAEKIGEVEDLSIMSSILNEAVYAKRTIREISEMVYLAKEMPTMGEAVETGLKTANELQTTQKFGKPCDSCEKRTNVVDMTVLWVCRECMAQNEAQTEIKSAHSVKPNE